MDKKVIAILAAAAVIVVVAAILIGVGMSGNNNNSDTSYTVTYDANGGNIDGEKTYSQSMKEFRSIAARYDEHKFDGWYLDKECKGTKMNDGDKLTKDITVYAKWGCTVTIEGGSIGRDNILSIECKDGAHDIAFASFTDSYDLPDSGKTRIVTNTGVTECSVVKNSENEDCLKFMFGDEALFTMIDLTGADSVTYGLNGAQGYIEFTYNRNVSLFAVIGEIKVRYDASPGYFDGDADKHVKVYGGSFNIVDTDTLNLTSTGGGTFVGWFTKSEGGDKYEVGTVIVPMTEMKLYAHYAPV